MRGAGPELAVPCHGSWRAQGSIRGDAGGEPPAAEVPSCAPGDLRGSAGTFAEGPLLGQRHRLLRAGIQSLELRLQLEELHARVADERVHGVALRSAADVEGLAEALVHHGQRCLGLLDRGGQDDLSAEHLAAPTLKKRPTFKQSTTYL